MRNKDGLGMDNSNEERENRSQCDTGNNGARSKYMILALQQHSRNKSEDEYSTTSEDDIIDTESDIDSDMDTDNDGVHSTWVCNACIPLYDNKNDYNPKFDCTYVNIRSERTAIDYIRLSLHSGGFYSHIRTQTYENELHMARMHALHSATSEDKRLEYIHTLYSDARDFYLERHGHCTTFITTVGSRDINNISEEEMKICQTWVRGPG